MINYTVYLKGLKNSKEVVYKGSEPFQVDPKLATAKKVKPDDLAKDVAKAIIRKKDLMTNGLDSDVYSFSVVRLVREIPMD